LVAVIPGAADDDTPAESEGIRDVRLRLPPIYLADTSALARLGHPSVAARLNPFILQGIVGRCGPIDLEMLRSARSASEFRAMRRTREEAFPLIPLNQSEVDAAIDLQQALEDGGLHRGARLPDLLIAAVAIRHNLTVLHYDHEYDNIASVSALKAEWVVPRRSVG
jgi:predicted nucleic acid-binding protein